MNYYLQKLDLDGLSEKSKGLFNFRCPICGDSKHSHKKKRAYYIESKDFVYCHNCGYHSNFRIFLKEIDPSVYSEYIKDTFLNEKKETTNEKKEVPIYYIEPKDFQFYKFDDKFLLQDEYSRITNKAKNYLINRKLNLENFYFSLNPKYIFKIILPIKNKKGIFGFQARDIFGKDPKYLTFYSDNSVPKIYNYDFVNKLETVFVVEGIFDSFFISNSIAILGSQITQDNLNFLKNYDLVFLFDNDETGKKRALQMLEKGYKVAKWNKKFLRYKDLNELSIGENIDKYAITKEFKNEIVSGLTGIVKLKLLR